MWLTWSLRGAGLVSASIMALIAGFVAWEALPALQSPGLWRFWSDAAWHPAGGAEAGQFGLAPMVAATLALAAGAALLATPLGVLSAMFSAFYAPPRLAALYRGALKLLAGLPSVIYGFWGLVTLAPLLRQWAPPGQSLLAGILILALMTLPTVALLGEVALRAVPAAWLRGAAALGLSRWATIRAVALPAARGELAAAALLATGRALGETMAVLMVSGNVVQAPRALTAPVRALTANIALELGYATTHHRAALFVSGLALMALTAALVALSAWGARDDEPA